MLVKASIESGAWWLASAILVSSILTVVALGRVFALSFWRMDAGETVERTDAERAISPGAGYGVLAALIVPAIAIGVYPEPFLRLAAAAAAGLADPASYLDAVFPPGGGS